MRRIGSVSGHGTVWHGSAGPQLRAAAARTSAAPRRIADPGLVGRACPVVPVGRALPPPGYRPAPGRVDAWVLRMSPAQTAAAERLSGLLDSNELQRVERCGAAAGREVLLTSHVVLRLLLGAQLGLPPDEVVVLRAACPGCGEPHGRPVVSAAPALHFSLSHSNGLAVCAFAATAVGVDVEALASIPGTELVPLLHPAEQEAIRRLPSRRQVPAFLSCWVRKEAYLKGTGEGLSAELGSVHVGWGADGGPRTVGQPGTGAWGLAHVATPPGYAGAVALLTPERAAAGLPEPAVDVYDVDLPTWAAHRIGY